MSDDKAEEIKRNILSPAQWIRILYMAFYAVACWVLLFVLPVIIVCQIIISLITGIDNRNLRDFGKALSDYFHQAMDFLVYASDDRPWPFTDGEDLGDAGFDADKDDDDDDDDDDDESDDDKGGSSSSTPDVGASIMDDTRESATGTSVDNDTADDTDTETKDRGDDVFSDISFTGDQGSDAGKTSGGDNADDDDNKKDPA